MISQHFVDRYRRDLDAEIQGLVEPLVTGTAENYEHYRETAGRIAAFKRARDLFDELVKQSNKGSI